MNLPEFKKRVISIQQTQAITNLFLSDYMPDRFTADQPHLTQTGDGWEVPIILTYPKIGSLGRVGTVMVSTEIEKVIDHTPFEEMKQAGQKLYEKNYDAIQTSFS
ncbi:MAG: hypothetical protein QNJ36_17685 [Calothrix sp. MO_167.B42]|nr:hypothetical protein [Calothrix sp. MO_167.B42]